MWQENFFDPIYLVFCKLLVLSHAYRLCSESYLLWIRWMYFLFLWFPGLHLLLSLVILSFSLFIVSPIYWIFCDKSLLDLTFSLTHESISSMVSRTHEIPSHISCILLFMFTFVILDYLLRFFLSRIPWACVFFIVSVSVFKSLTISFTCLIVFFLGLL